MDLLIVTGLSGAGKHAVLGALEDQGCTALDNVPVRLLMPLLEIETRQNPERRLAVGMDSRQEGFAEAFEPLLLQLRDSSLPVHVVFVEATEEVLLRRFSETRRPHPLAREISLTEAIKRERQLLAPVRAQATAIVDTSHLTLAQMRQRVAELLPILAERCMTLRLLSFGFKNGLPPEVDMLLDARFLINPHYVAELRPLTGKDEEVQAYLLRSESFQTFLNKTESWIRWALPQIQAEGRAYHTIAIGCTGGQHRSVALAELLGKRLKVDFPNLTVRHREQAG